ncbi:MAG: hypothetical protein NC091_09095 [Bacteroides sp.]|nr:hypothetical protein [Bacteroides sp.]
MKSKTSTIGRIASAEQPSPVCRIISDVRLSPVRRLTRNFVKCGLAGWCLEILFTALASLRRRNLRLKGNTSLWMFPIYGSIAFLEPMFRLMQKHTLLLRGLTYMSLIFSAEFLTGRLLIRRKLCPWDYSRSRYRVGRVIRLDYAPWWFAAGLFFERLLCRTQLQDETPRISSRSVHKR